MEAVERAPDSAPFVVRFNRAWLSRQYTAVVPVGVLGLFAVMIGLGILRLNVTAGVVVSVVGLALVGLAVHGAVSWVRSAGDHVALAAGDSGVWLTLSLRRRPGAVHLPWAEISKVRTASWAGPSGRHVRFLCFDAPAAAAGLAQAPALATATRRAQNTFGTPFVLSDRGKDTDIFGMLRGIAPIAGDAGVEIEALLPG